MLNRRTSLSALMTPALGVWAGGTAVMQQDPEIATSVDDGFTIAMVGDLIYAHDLGHMMTDPSFAAVVELLREADVATGTRRHPMPIRRRQPGPNQPPLR